MATRKTLTVNKSIYNITNELGNLANKYSNVQGYTVTTGVNRAHFFTARREDVADDIAVGFIFGSTKISQNRGLGHANDCAYYDSGCFIAQGGGTTKNTKVKRLNNALEHVATYTYSPMDSSSDKLENITNIAYLTSNFFILGEQKNVQFVN